jgi:hypothetical protein
MSSPSSVLRAAAWLAIAIAIAFAIIHISDDRIEANPTVPNPRSPAAAASTSYPPPSKPTSPRAPSRKSSASTGAASYRTGTRACGK